MTDEIESLEPVQLTISTLCHSVWADGEVTAAAHLAFHSSKLRAPELVDDFHLVHH